MQTEPLASSATNANQQSYIKLSHLLFLRFFLFIHRHLRLLHAPMARTRKTEYLSPQIVNRGVENTGPYAGSPSFSIRVQRGLPDFLSSVNLKYVRLGYDYLINRGVYFVALPVLLMVFATQVGQLTWDVLVLDYYNLQNMTLFVGFLSLVSFVYLDLIPRTIHLIDFACYLPPNELKITKQEYIDLVKKSGQFSDAAIEFQQRVLKNSGLGDATYMPQAVFRPGYTPDLIAGREEAAMVIFGAVDELLRSTGIRPQTIRIVVVNCGVLNTTPSLSAMIINHYKLSHRIQSFNLGGMGCAASINAVDLARDLLTAYPRNYALVVSTEVISSTWYGGNQPDMLLPNCFLRMGAAAILLSNHRRDRWRSKYQLKQVVRTHRGMDDKAFQSIQLKEDCAGKQGISVRRDLIELGGYALKANITTLSPLVLPVSEQFHFFKSLIFSQPTSSKPYIPDYMLAFDHVCIGATSKKVLDEIQRNLNLTDEYMEASRKTLERFGNTSSSSIWYELAYLEAHDKINSGDRVWQLALGSGLKCNSVVWRAGRGVGRMKRRRPWIE